MRTRVFGRTGEEPLYVGGFARGDVISEVNHAPVNSVAEYRRAVSGLKAGQDVLFKVQRRSGSDQFDTVYLAGVVPAPEQ